MDDTTTQSPTNDPPALEAVGISKRFDTVVANQDVNLRVEKGQIHALLGENGAGKSTLVNILFGLYRADEGEVRVNGAPVRMDSPHNAIDHHIGMVHQHFQLVPVLTAMLYHSDLESCMYTLRRQIQADVKVKAPGAARTRTT